MKIVFLAPFGIRPKGTLLARMIPLAKGLAERGHEVVIIAPPYTNPEDAGREETVAGIRLRNIRLDSTHGMTPLVFAWRMLVMLCQESPDLVHLFKPKGYGGLAAMPLIQLRRLGARTVPVVVDSDDWEGRGGMNDLLPYSRAERWVFAFQEQWLLRHASAVTVASRELERMVRHLAGRRLTLLYLPNGVTPLPPVSGGRIRMRLGIPVDAPVVLLYTRFFEFAQERLHTICAELYRGVPGLRILVVGGGRNSEEDRLVEAGRKQGFAEALVMAGWVEPAELAEYLAVGDVAPYLFDDTLVNRTKCPAKLTELVNAGVAVVADRVGQIAEYLPEENGGLCDPGDWRTMVCTLSELLRDPLRQEAVAAAQYAHMHGKFSWGVLSESLDTLLIGLQSARPTPSIS